MPFQKTVWFVGLPLMRWRLRFPVQAFMRVLFLAMIVPVLTSCSLMPAYYRSPEVSGIAIDPKTGGPAAGLTVTVEWKAIRRSDNPHNPDILVIHNATGVTDTNGAFVFPAWGPVRYSAGWRYFSDAPVVSFSKSETNLGDFLNQANIGASDEIYPFPFFTVNFGKPSWNGQKLLLRAW